MHRLLLAALVGMGMFGTGCHHLFWHHHPPIHRPVRVAAATAIVAGAVLHEALHHHVHRPVYVYHDCE